MWKYLKFLDYIGYTKDYIDKRIKISNYITKISAIKIHFITEKYSHTNIYYY